MFDEFLWRRRLGDVRSLLETEKDLLLAGAISELASLDERRAAIVRRLRGAPEEVLKRNVRIVRKIRSLAERNQNLLAAYLDGAREAARKLAELEIQLRSMGAYRRDGRPVEASTPNSTTQKRA